MESLNKMGKKMVMRISARGDFAVSKNPGHQALTVPLYPALLLCLSFRLKVKIFCFLVIFLMFYPGSGLFMA